MRKMMLLAAALLGIVMLSARPVAQAGSPCTVPASWGRLASTSTGSFSNTIFAFEAADGTVRTVPGNCKSPAAPIDMIHRSAD